MRVDDIAAAIDPRGYFKARGAGPLRECTLRRTNNRLIVAKIAQSSRKSQKRLLPAPPSGFGIDMCDLERAQTLNVSLGRRRLVL